MQRLPQPLRAGLAHTAPRRGPSALGRRERGHLGHRTGRDEREVHDGARPDAGSPHHDRNGLNPALRERRYRVTRRVTVAGAVTNTGLAAIQIGAGLWYGSAALIADGVHTLSDLLSDGVVLLSAAGARSAPDATHPYGHGRFENLATTVIALLLLAAAIAIAVDAVGRLRNPADLTALSPWVLLFAALTLVAKETLYHVTRHAARTIRSPMLEANAWHHRSDAASSLVVFMGLVVAVVGVPAMDAVAALAVAAFIAWLALRMLWSEGNKLIDAALPEHDVARIRAAAASVPGVVGVHDLRTRWIGSDAACDLHVEVAATISVSEGHAIGEAVARAVRAACAPLVDVTVHVDPKLDTGQIDELERPTRPTMDRERLLAAARDALAALTDDATVTELTLHDVGDATLAIATLAVAPRRTADWSLSDLQALDRALVADLERRFANEPLPVRWRTALQLGDASAAASHRPIAR